jgi:hypothetical protein
MEVSHFSFRSASPVASSSSLPSIISSTTSLHNVHQNTISVVKDVCGKVPDAGKDVEVSHFSFRSASPIALQNIVPSSPSHSVVHEGTEVADRSPSVRKDVEVRRSHSPLFTHVRVHTMSDTIHSQLNRLVDHIASHAYRCSCPPPTAPIPLFTMDEFSPHTAALGFFDSSIFTMVDNALADLQVPHPSFIIVSHTLYDPHPPPEYHYIRARSAYSATIQLYA